MFRFAAKRLSGQIKSSSLPSSSSLFQQAQSGASLFASKPSVSSHPGSLGSKASKRFWTYGAGAVALGAGGWLVMSTFEEAMVFYLTPSQLAAKVPPPSTRTRIRLGGLVVEGSITHEKSPFNTSDSGRVAKSATQASDKFASIAFVVTDYGASTKVSFQGVLPDLFREGSSVVMDGYVQPDGSFKAVEVLAKHDENYMPPEVAAALAANGKDASQPHPGSPQPSATPEPQVNAAVTNPSTTQPRNSSGVYSSNQAPPLTLSNPSSPARASASAAPYSSSSSSSSSSSLPPPSSLSPSS